MKRVPKISRIPLAENLIPKIVDIFETPSSNALWSILIPSLKCFLEKSPRGGKRKNKRIRDGVIEKKTETRQKPAAKSRVRSTNLFRLD